MNVIKRKYQLVDRNVRKSVNLQNYANYIEEAYQKTCGSNMINIEVEEDCFYLYGNITNRQLRQVGHYLSSFTPLKSYCLNRGKYNYLFKCYEKQIVPYPF